MKFGKQLVQVVEEADNTFSENLMNYKSLKKTLKTCQAEAKKEDIEKFSSDEENRPCELEGCKKAIAEAVAKMPNRAPVFFSHFESEILKVNNFFADQEREIRSVVRTVLAKEKELGGKASTAELSALRAQFHELNRTLVQVEQFVFFNLTGFHKILKKFDKKTESNVRGVVTPDVAAQPFAQASMIPKLIKMSEAKFKDLTDRLRAAKLQASNGLALDSPLLPPANKTPLQLVFSAARQQLSGTSNPETAALAAQVNGLTMADLGDTISSAINSKGIKYFDLFDDTEFCLGVFILPPGAMVPLHERPRAGVSITKVLSGKMAIKSYALVNGSDAKKRKLSAPAAGIKPAEAPPAPVPAVQSLDSVHSSENAARVVNSQVNQYRAVDGPAVLFVLSTGPSAGDYETWTFYEAAGTQSGNLVDVAKLAPVARPKGFEVARESYVSWNHRSGGTAVTPMKRPL